MLCRREGERERVPSYLLYFVNFLSKRNIYFCAAMDVGAREYEPHKFLCIFVCVQFALFLLSPAIFCILLCVEPSPSS